MHHILRDGVVLHLGKMCNMPSVYTANETASANLMGTKSTQCYIMRESRGFFSHIWKNEDAFLQTMTRSVMLIIRFTALLALDNGRVLQAAAIPNCKH